jgi:hypothetical protein
MRISEPIDTKGHFWLPGKPDQRLLGELHVSETGETTLTLFGIFGGFFPAFAESTSSDLFRVVGKVENGDFVTLDRCSYRNRNRSLSTGGLSTSTIHATLFLSGWAYGENDPIVAYKFRFSLEGLDEWLPTSELYYERDWEKGNVSIHLKSPEKIVCQLPDDVKLIFHFEPFWSAKDSPVEANIKQKTYVTIESNSQRPIEDFHPLVFRISNFLRFAIDENVALDSAAFYSHEIRTIEVNEEKLETPVKLYYRSAIMSDTRPKISWRNMLFHYQQVADQLEVMVNKWLSNYEASEPAFNLYFASKTGAYKYIDGRFLSLAQGIETLHRRNSEATLMPELDFEAFVAALTENDFVAELARKHFPDDPEWLKNKMKYSNELPLRKRVIQMLEPFKELYGSKDQRKSFIRKVVDTRNYLTHYDKRLSPSLADGDSLYNLCMKLEALFQLHFLQLIGLDKNFIDKLLRSSSALERKLKIDCSNFDFSEVQKEHQNP